MKNQYLYFYLIILNLNLFLSKQLNHRNTASSTNYIFLPTKDNVKISGRYYQKKILSRLSTVLKLLNFMNLEILLNLF